MPAAVIAPSVPLRLLLHSLIKQTELAAVALLADAAVAATLMLSMQPKIAVAGMLSGAAVAAGPLVDAVLPPAAAAAAAASVP